MCMKKWVWVRGVGVGEFRFGVFPRGYCIL